MIVKHPTRSGWLIVRPEIETLLNATHQLLLPDGAAVHPLHFYEADILTVEAARVYGLSYLDTWRGERRAALGLTQAAFQELVYSGKMMQAQRWLDNTELPFPFSYEATARGISNQAMAELIVQQGEAWLSGSDMIEGAYILAKTAIAAADDEAAIVAVLVGLE